MISVIDESGDTGATHAEAAALPLRVRARDVGGFEGIPPSHAFARRSVRVNSRLIEVWVQFGHRRLTAADLNRANRLLRRVDVSRP
jgi:hypothetical protein